MRALVRAEMDVGYDGVQRLLLDLDRFGYALVDLRVREAEDSSAGLVLEALVGGLDPARAASVASRLMRHPSVRHALVVPGEQAVPSPEPVVASLGEVS